MSNQVFFGNEAATGLKKGIDTGADCVEVTLGGNGRTVVIYKNNGQHLENTKDGVTAITSLRLKDQLQDAGLKMVQEVSAKTAQISGDGTTSVIVLMREMITQGLLLKQSGVNVNELKKGMDKACKSITDTLKTIKKDVGTNKKLLIQVATTSANNDSEIGEFIGGIYDKLGVNASIIVEDGQSAKTTVELVNGFQFSGGYFSEYFVNTKHNTVELANPYILIIEGKIENMKDIAPILEKIIVEKRSVVIMAEDFSHSVLANILKNVLENKVLKAHLIKHPFTGETKDELLLDLCAVTGATLITPKTGKIIENINTSYLGQCEKVVSKKDETTIFNGKNNKGKISLRIDDIKKKIGKAKNTFMKEKYELRLAKLSGAVAIYYVGGIVNAEIGEKMARIDDSLRATKCSMEEGVLPGGGTALIRCIANISKLEWKTESEKSGINLVQKSIEKPLFQIAKNSGKSGDLIVGKVKEKTGSFGYNCKTDKIEDLFKAGVIDPVKVVRVCIENAVAGAGQFLISVIVIVDEIN